MKILLIEDDIFFQKFYLEKLKEKGYLTEAASDGEEGLQKVSSFQPDLIILDMIMPKKDGFEVLKELSNNASFKKIPVLVFSTLGQESDVEKAKKLGAIGYVNKSLFDFDDLILKIQNLNKKV